MYIQYLGISFSCSSHSGSPYLMILPVVQHLRYGLSVSIEKPPESGPAHWPRPLTVSPSHLLFLHLYVIIKGDLSFSP